MFKNSAEVFAYIKKENVKLVDVRFIDLPGIQHHFNVPVESFDEAVFTDGLMSMVLQSVVSKQFTNQI